MRRLHASTGSCLLVATLMFALGSPAIAQRDTPFGLCHTDAATGETLYLEVPESEIRGHMAHGDWTAPNGPDDCFAPDDPEVVEEESRPTEAPPDAREEPSPVAQDDEYEAEIGVPLVVPAPGVLANDQGATSAVLVREPSWGTLDFGRDGSFT